MRKTVVLVCALSFLASFAVLAGCGSGGGSSTSPEGATKAFLAAAMAQDVDATWDMLSHGTLESVKDKATLAGLWVSLVVLAACTLATYAGVIWLLRREQK